MTDAQRGATDKGREVIVLTLNSGSSSLKFGLYKVGPAQAELLLCGQAESIGGSQGNFRAADSQQREMVSENVPIPTQREAIIRIGKLIGENNMPTPAAIGHRIVHGGPKLRQHCVVDDSVLRQLAAASAFAPLHTPTALTVLSAAREHFPGRMHVACFDTNFHAEMPEVASTLPIPSELQSEGIERYGFHGLSIESIVHQLGRDLPRRLVVAHLGNGASVTAVKSGKSIDTSMGLTPTGGVIMGTRSGDLDPGVLIYLMREKKFDATMIEELVNQRSGLLGISGIGSDMRRLHEAAGSNAAARLAIQMFCYCVRKQVAAMIAALEGIDMLVFTGGIGENDAQVRAAICAGLSCMGVRLDEERNRSANNPLSDPASRCLVRVLAAQENGRIARHTWALVPQGRS